MAFLPARVSQSLAQILLAPAALLWLRSAAFAQAAPAAADSRIPALLADLGKVRTPNTAAISPDGTFVAWSVSGPRGSELHLTGIAPEGSAQDASWERVLSPDTIGDVTNSHPGLCTASHPAWSPNGKQLAFLSDCSGSNADWHTGKQDNIFVWTLAVNELKQVSDLHGAIS